MKLRKMFGERGFTLVEIMIVVAIIGLLAAVAIPNFMKAREKALTNACIANLKQVDGAKTLYHLDEGSAATSVADLVTAYIRREPECPAGPNTTYGIGSGVSEPTCPNVATLTDHHL